MLPAIKLLLNLARQGMGRIQIKLSRGVRALTNREWLSCEGPLWEHFTCATFL